jgi:phage-related protein
VHLRVVFYREGDNEPVRDWLKALTKPERKAIGEDIKTVQVGWPVGMPVCRPLGGGLFEVRSQLRGRVSRVIFCFAEGAIVLLHGFMKKTQKTPVSDLRMARRRQEKVGG